MPRDRLTVALCYVAVFSVFFVLGWMAQPTITSWFDDGIDCGPDGKPALDGTACIDKEPATTTLGS